MIILFIGSKNIRKKVQGRKKKNRVGQKTMNQPIFFILALSRLILSKSGQGIFNVHSNLSTHYAHKGEMGTDSLHKPGQGRTEKLALHPVLTRNHTHSSCCYRITSTMCKTTMQQPLWGKTKMADRSKSHCHQTSSTVSVIYMG